MCPLLFLKMAVDVVIMGLKGFRKGDPCTGTIGSTLDPKQGPSGKRAGAGP